MSKEIDVNIRFYEPGDDEGIVELLRKTFPKWAEFKDPIGLWRWKYIDNPLKHLIILAVIDDKIVGCEHAVIFNAKLGSEITTLGYSDDLAVDTDYRGLGIWNKILKLKNEKFPNLAKYTYETTVNPIVIKSWAKRNRSPFPFPVTRMIKTNNIDFQLKERPMKNGFLVKIGYIFLDYINKIRNLFRPPIETIHDFQIVKITEFDDNIDSFWNQVKNDYNFIIEKKHEYLNWRYTDNDRGNHAMFQAMNSDKVLGFAVVGFKEGFSEGHIEDLIAFQDRIDVADALLDYSCNYLNNLDINTIYYQLVEGHPYQDLSRRKGFIDTRSRPKIVFDYGINWLGNENKSEIPFLKITKQSQVYFNYSDTI